MVELLNIDEGPSSNRFALTEGHHFFQVEVDQKATTNESSEMWIHLNRHLGNEKSTDGFIALQIYESVEAADLHRVCFCSY